MRAVRLLVAALCALALGVGPALAATPASTTPMTKITITLANCSGCTVTPEQAILKVNSKGGTVGTPVDHTYASATFHHGKAVVHVPTKHTAGLSFSLTGPHFAALPDANSVATLRFQGRAVGATVTTYGALRSKKGSWCWAGTAKSTASIHLHLHHFHALNDGGQRETYYTFWATPGLAVWTGQNMQRTVDGGLGTQEAPYCLITTKA
jgi:hypothetical protein